MATQKQVNSDKEKLIDLKDYVGKALSDSNGYCGELDIGRGIQFYSARSEHAEFRMKGYGNVSITKGSDVINSIEMTIYDKDGSNFCSIDTFCTEYKKRMYKRYFVKKALNK